jgi:hypothetical protein
MEERTKKIINAIIRVVCMIVVILMGLLMNIIYHTDIPISNKLGIDFILLVLILLMLYNIILEK